MKRGNIIIIVVFIAIIAVAIIGYMNQEVYQQPPQVDVLKPTLQYRIVNKSTMNTVKVSMDVIVNRNLTYPELKRLSNELKGDLKEDYDRIFIMYYQDERNIGRGAYARAIFNPYLEYDILKPFGNEDLINASVLDSNETFVGKWADTFLGMEPLGKIMYRIGDSYYCSNFSPTEKSEGVRLEIRTVNNQKRFYFLDNNEYGEYFILDQNRAMNLFDNDGFIISLPLLKD